MESRFVLAQKNFLIVKIIYGLISIFTFFLLIVIFLTDGSLKSFFLQNLNICLLVPFLIICFFAYTGFYSFSFKQDKFFMSISSKCIALGEFISDYNINFEIPLKSISSYYEIQNFFGVKKIIFLTFNINKNKIIKRINISMLSKNELFLLRKYLNEIVEYNKSKI